MKELKMAIEQIRSNFGDLIASQCEQMKNEEVREFSTTTYNSIIVRCESYFCTFYYVSGEAIIENALEVFVDGLGLDF